MKYLQGVFEHWVGGYIDSFFELKFSTYFDNPIVTKLCTFIIFLMLYQNFAHTKTIAHKYKVFY